MMLYNTIQPQLYATFSSLLHTLFWVATRRTCCPVFFPIVPWLATYWMLLVQVFSLSFPVTLGTEE